MWNLKGSSTVSLNVNADDNGGFSGTITHQGISYHILYGQWRAGGASPNDKNSVFNAMAMPNPGQNVDSTTYLTTVGVMFGPGSDPESIDIQGSVVSSGDGVITLFQEKLLP